MKLAMFGGMTALSLISPANGLAADATVPVHYEPTVDSLRQAEIPESCRVLTG